MGPKYLIWKPENTNPPLLCNIILYACLQRLHPRITAVHWLCLLRRRQCRHGLRDQRRPGCIVFLRSKVLAAVGDSHFGEVGSLGKRKNHSAQRLPQDSTGSSGCIICTYYVDQSKDSSEVPHFTIVKWEEVFHRCVCFAEIKHKYHYCNHTWWK